MTPAPASCCASISRRPRRCAARLDSGTLRTAAERARALGDPTRLQVALAVCEGGELCVCDLAWVCERSDKLVSHHARALRRAGLVDSRREGKMVIYSLTSAAAPSSTRSSARACPHE